MRDDKSRNDKTDTKSVHVIGPDGDVMTAADLPPKNLNRWVARRKAEVVIAVHGGLLSLAEACERYNISPEEFLAWERDYAQGGLEGLRASRHPHGAPGTMH
jgi:hypothetical protein